MVRILALLIIIIYALNFQTISNGQTNIKDVYLLPRNTDKETYTEVVTVTAYNVGDINQCSGDTCVGAYGNNLCDELRKGRCVVAGTPFISLGSWVIIHGRVCRVVDRFNKRYNHLKKIDIAMPKDKRQEALNLGIKEMEIEIIIN